MRLTRIHTWQLLTSLIAAFFLSTAFAEDLVIGQVCPLSGVVAETGKDAVLGARVYFESVNANGGINGRKIRHVTKDDQYKVAETVRLVNEVIEKDNAIALIGLAGTGNIGELLKLKTLDKANIALVGPYTGAGSLRYPFNRNLFHIRAGYDDEIEEMVRQLTTLNVNKIGVFYQNDPFGQTGLELVKEALKKRNLTVHVAASYEKGTADVDKAVTTIAAARPDAIIMISLNKSTAAFTKKYRAVANAYQLINISVVNPKELVRLAGPENARGIGITQVMPSPQMIGIPIVKEYQRAMKKYAPEAEPNYTSLETFIAAKVLVEGIRRAGAGATRDKVIRALETMNSYDTGGLTVHFSPTNHLGSKFVELTILDKNGKLLR